MILTVKKPQVRSPLINLLRCYMPSFYFTSFSLFLFGRDKDCPVVDRNTIWRISKTIFQTPSQPLKKLQSVSNFYLFHNYEHCSSRSKPRWPLSSVLTSTYEDFKLKFTGYYYRERRSTPLYTCTNNSPDQTTPAGKVLMRLSFHPVSDAAQGTSGMCRGDEWSRSVDWASCGPHSLALKVCTSSLNTTPKPWQRNAVNYAVLSVVWVRISASELEPAVAYIRFQVLVSNFPLPGVPIRNTPFKIF